MKTRSLHIVAVAVAVAAGTVLSARAEDPYIESDATQGVVLDYYVNPKTKIVADFEFTSVVNQYRLFGAEGADGLVTCCLYISGGNVFAWAYRNGSGDYQWTTVTATTNRHTFVLDGPNRQVDVIKDGETLNTKTTVNAVTATANYPLAVFCECTSIDGKSLSNKCKAKIYSLAIYEDDVLVRDLRPWQASDGRYGFKDTVNGKVYLSSVGNNLTGGGDIVYTSGAFTWAGAESTDWNTAANWQGTPEFPPQIGDAVTIGGTASIDIGNAQETVASLTLSGGGTVSVTGSQTLTMAESLVVESGTTLSLASGTALYVSAASYGGVALADGRYAGGSLEWLEGNGVLVVGTPSAVVEDNVLILDAPAGQTVAYYDQLASPITKIVKIGAGTGIVSNDNNGAWIGTVDVKEGYLEAQSAVGGTTATIPVFGSQAANTITVYKGAQLIARVPGGVRQETPRFPNNLVMAGDGPDGYGAVRLIRYYVSGSHGSLDRLFTNVTLSDDAAALADRRSGFSGGTFNLNGHTFTHRNTAWGSTEFMMLNTTVTNGHLYATNSSSMVTQGTVNYRGTTNDTITISSGANFSIWNVTFNAWDWKLILKGGSMLRVGAGTTAAKNKILGPIVLDGGTVTVTNYSPTASGIRLNLAGQISGTGKMFHNGNHDTYLLNQNNSWTGGAESRWGTIWATETGTMPPVGPITASGSGKINFVAKDWDLATLHTTLTNWNASGAVNVYTADGETFTDDVDFVYPAPYRHGGAGTLTFTAATTPEGGSKLINGEGEMIVSGNKTRRLTQLNVLGGTMTLDNAGTLWAGTWDTETDSNSGYVTWRVGGSNSTTPAKMVMNSGSLIDSKVLPGSNRSSYFHVEDTGTKGAIFEVNDGAAFTNWLGVASTLGNAKGAFYQNGGSVYNLCINGFDGYVGRYANSYGHVNLMGGLLAMRSWWRVGGAPSAVGVMRMSGGTFNANSSLCLSFGGWGEMYMTGGEMNAGSALKIGELHWGDNTAGEFDKMRGTLTLGGDGDPRFTANWVDTCERTNTFTGVVNMNAGVLSTPMLCKSDYLMSNRDNEKARSFVNFGGGTWQAYADSANIFGAGVRVVNRVTVFPGGATLDINGKTSSNAAVPFEKPFGKGVASIEIPSGTTMDGYIGPPEVYITGGGGTGAVAHCTFDAPSGTIGEIVVASPGWGYTSAPTATIMTSDRKTTIACTVTLTDGDDQPGGGLTLTNSSATAGTFTLSAANSYTGATVVAGGTLKLGAADAIPAANEVRLAGGTFDANSYDVSYARFGGYGTLEGNVTVTDALTFDAAQPQSSPLVVNGTLTFGDGATIEVANTNLLTRGSIYTLATLPTAMSSVPSSNLPRPWSLYLTDGGKTLKMHYQDFTQVILR